jgi:GNAT superfamily N-acetyltransferase
MSDDDRAMDVEIRPLTPEVWPALARLFESGGDPRWCWCMFWRERGSGIGRGDAGSNRDRLRALAGDRPAPGLVAMDADGAAMGWVALGPRDIYERLEHSRVRPRIDATPVWSIVCFVVDRRQRHRGLEGQLLRGAIDFARAHGAPAVEAYPVDASLGRPTAATLYSGTLSTFLRAGFSVARTVESPAATVARSIVRLDLAGDGEGASSGG